MTELGLRIPHTRAHWVSGLGTEGVVQYLVNIGKAKVVKSGQGRSVILTDREMMSRVNNLLTPREDVDPLTLVIEGIRKLANPLSGYADIGDIIKYIEGRLNVPTKEAEEFLIKVIKFHRG